MNISWHWPSRGNIRRKSQPISPENYAKCFKLVRKAIKQVQPSAWVIPSGVNPLKHPKAEYEDALHWFEAILGLIDELDGFDIHSYFPDRDSYRYEEFLQRIPANKQHLPVFLTEVTPPEPWSEPADGWMQNVYAKIDQWNRDPANQKVYAVLPYRWQGTYPDGNPDPWNLVDKSSYRQDFREVLKYDYRWTDEAVQNSQISTENSTIQQSTKPNKKIDSSRNETDTVSSEQDAVTASDSTSNSESSTELNNQSAEPNDRIETTPTLLPQPPKDVASSVPSGSSTTSTQTSGRQNAPEIILPPSLYKEPPAKDTVRISVYSNTVVLEYEDRKYFGPNLIHNKKIELNATGKDFPQRHGELLFNTIIHDQLNQVNQSVSILRGYAAIPKSAKLAFELALEPNNLELHRYRWEYLKDPNEAEFLALRENRPFYRRHDHSDKNSVSAKPIKILVAICNPSDLGDPNNSILKDLAPINVDKEREILEPVLEDLKSKELAEYEFLDGRT
ncbi:MAG: hypothetical protein AB1589_42810, partial [Cyanobacteriota bacterium]